MTNGKNDERIEAQQGEIAEGMGVSWEAYAQRAKNGVHLFQAEDWRKRFFVRFQWRPKIEFFVPSSGFDGLSSMTLQAEAADRAHNQAILAAIPKTEPVEATDILSVTVRRWQEPGMTYKFLSPFAIGSLGMRGYTPVFDDEGHQVLVDGYLMLCQKPLVMELAHAAVLADCAAAELVSPIPEGGSTTYIDDEPVWHGKPGHVDGDIVRITWRFWSWRGVAAFYRHTPQASAPPKPRRGLEIMTQWRGHAPNSIRLGFYKRPV